MSRRLTKIFAIIAVTALLLSDIEPAGTFFANLSDVVSEYVGQVSPELKEAVNTVADGLSLEPVEVAAADYNFLIGDILINDGGEIDYTNYRNGQRTLKIILRAADGIPAGTKITWTTSNDNIVQIKEQNDSENSVTLNILSPGYSGLSVSLEYNGLVQSAVAYCSLHVPLEWSDDEKPNDNIKATSSSPYGLMLAQNGEQTSNYTLQLYTADAKGHPNQYHYLRKLRYISYEFETGAAQNYAVNGVAPEYVPSNIEASDLKQPATTLTWESSDPTVVEVDSATGLITAVSAGFARVTVKTDTINERLGDGDSLSFNVVVVPDAYVVGYTTDMVNEFLVTTDPNQEEIVIQTNAKTADVLSWKLFQGDQAVKSKDITAKYKSNIEIGEANGRVVISDLPAGVYYLTAIAVKDATASRVLPTYDIIGANIQALRIIIIVPIKFPPRHVTLVYYNSTFSDSYDLMANSNLPASTFRFTSMDTNIASVNSSTGVVEAKGVGTTDIIINKISDKGIKAIFGAYAASPAAIAYDGTDYPVEVEVVRGVQISSTSEVMALGSSLQLDLVAPSPYEGEIVWTSSNEKVVKVDETGIVTAVGEGDAVIRVKVQVNGVTKGDACKIKVIAAVDTITLNSKKDYVEVGENLTISATVSPKLSNAELVWSVSDEKIATISDSQALSMTITGVSAGTVVVTAVNKDNAIVATKVIKVIDEITSLRLSDSEVTLPQTVGFYQLYAYCTPGLPENQSLKWLSSNTKVLTVDQNGKVTILKPGVATITVNTPNGLVAQCNFTITKGVDSVTFDEKELTLYVGDKYRMTYTVKPANASNVTLKWEVYDSKIATVDASGYISAKNVGTTIVMARTTDGTGIIEMCTVNVLRKATSIKVDVPSLSMDVGDVYQLEATVQPADSSDKLKFESSNTKIATVSSKGKVTAKGKGVCIIAITTDSGLPPVYVNVEVAQPITGLVLNPMTAAIEVDEELKLEATVQPKNASENEVVWSTTNAKVVTVAKDGTIKGISGGMAVVWVETADGEFRTGCIVTVTEHVTNITLVEEASVKIGEKLKLVAKIDNVTATNKDVVWASSDESIATVDNKGVVRGKNVGTCLITVTAADGSGAVAECELTVFGPVVTVEEEVSIGVGKKLKLNATIDGQTATNKNSIWKTSNKKIATVTDKGVVKGVKAGTCIITVTAADGSGAYAECEVTVFNATSSIDIDPDMNLVELYVGESKTVAFTVDPTPVTFEPTWSSNDTSIAIVNSKGTITGLKAGTTTVVLTAGDDPNITGIVTVIVKNPVLASNITFDQTEMILAPGETNNIVAAFQPGKITESFTWSSDNPLVASVDNNGRVTGKSLGTANITLMTKESGKKATVKVYVIGLSQTNVTLHQYDKLKLKLDIVGLSTAGLNVHWDTENQDIAEMSNGNVTAKALGTTNVYAQVNGYKLYCKIHVIKNLK